MSTRRTTIRPDSWAGLALNLLRELEHEASLSTLYPLIEQRAPEKLAPNPTWKATVRRTIQELRDQGLLAQIAKGVWQYQANDQAVATPRKRQRRKS